MHFFDQFGWNQFIALVLGTAVIVLAKTIGTRIARHLIRLNDNLERVGATIHKADIMWDRSADAAMYRELERRERNQTQPRAAVPHEL